MSDQRLVALLRAAIRDPVPQPETEDTVMRLRRQIADLRTLAAFVLTRAHGDAAGDPQRALAELDGLARWLLSAPDNGTAGALMRDAVERWLREHGGA